VPFVWGEGQSEGKPGSHDHRATDLADNDHLVCPGLMPYAPIRPDDRSSLGDRLYDPYAPHDSELLRAWRLHSEHPQYQYPHMGWIRQYSMSLQDHQEVSKQYRMPMGESPLKWG